MSTLEIRGFFQRLFRRLGWEVQRATNANSERQVLKKVLKLTGADVVLDVGANVGQFGDLLLDLPFEGTLISFEAIPQIHKQLAQHAHARSRSWLVAPCAALGSRSGEVEINISENSVSSSVLPMRMTHLVSAPDSRYIGSQTVNIERLDQLAAQYIRPAAKVLIKVDTQGYEMEVLKGADGLWPRAVALQLELSLVPLYDQAPTFLEMLEFTASKGFELFGFVPGFRDQQSGRLLQIDGFFVRADSGSTKN